MFISGGKPFTSFEEGFELVAGTVHETVDSEWDSIIIVFLFLFHVAAEVDISGREITLEKVSQEIMGGFPTSRELVLCDLDEGIELVNVTFELLKLFGKRGEVLTEDSSGGLSVNESFTDNDLDEKRGAREIANVPSGMPDLNLAKSGKSQ